MSFYYIRTAYLPNITFCIYNFSQFFLLYLYSFSKIFIFPKTVTTMVTHHSATSKQKSKAHFQALKALQKSKMCQLEGGIIRKVSEMLLDGIACRC